MNILITGCNGQLGNEMQLLEKQNPQHTYYNTDVAELDITDQAAIEQFVEANQIDGIVNCAAYTAVDKAEDNEELCQKLNAEAPAYLAHAVGKRGGWMIQISTDYVFDGTGTEPWKPDCKDYYPINIYGETKLGGEFAVTEAIKKFFIVRIAWVFGLNGNNFVKTMLRVGKTHKQLRVVNDQVGTPTYTFDLARLLVDMVESEKYGYYHATNEGGYISWYEFATEIFRQASLKWPEAGYDEVSVSPVTTEEYGLSAAARPFNSRLDKSKLSDAGFERLPVWQDALARYLDQLDCESI